MPTWDELFNEKKNILYFPQTEVMKFINRLESTFDRRPLTIWDLCCGAGRNSVAIAKVGHDVYSSDVSPTGVTNLESLLRAEDLHCETEICDMSENPWEKHDFDGIFCWDALHHNTIANIKVTADMVYDSLTKGGLFMASLLSTKSGQHNRGRQIEHNTFIEDQGLESGVPHHYFDDKEIMDLFKDWKINILAEIVVNYVETENEFYMKNPFSYTKWNVLVTKES
jgi:cyclopropane fatty-acyl-phospholipid synthase-like methyltransferase